MKKKFFSEVERVPPVDFKIWEKKIREKRKRGIITFLIIFDIIM